MVVLCSLLDGSRKYDQLSEDVKAKLGDSLLDLVSNREVCYAHVLSNIAPRDSCQASKIFQVIQHWYSYQKRRDAAREYFPKLCSTNLSFAFEDNSPQDLTNEPISVADIRERRDRVDVWLKGCCGGLIELPDEKSTRGETNAPGAPWLSDAYYDAGSKHLIIRYFDGSVQGYLSKPEVWDVIIKKNTDKAFTVEHVVLKSLILQIKTWASKGGRKEVCPWDLIISTLRYAYHAEQRVGVGEVSLLDELDKCVAQHFQKSVLDKYFPRYNGRAVFQDSHWSEFWPTDFPRTVRWRDNFLALAVRLNLFQYLQAKLEEGGSNVLKKDGRPLLDYAFYPVFSGFFVNPKLIEALLKNGADPNEPFDNSSPWQNFLRYLMEHAEEAREYTNQASEITELLLEYGANPNAECDFFQISEDIPRVCSAIDVIQNVFLDESAEIIVGLRLRGVLLRRQRTISNARESLLSIRVENCYEAANSTNEIKKAEENTPDATKSKWKWFSRKQPR